MTKAESDRFRLQTTLTPCGDQPRAIAQQLDALGFFLPPYSDDQ